MLILQRGGESGLTWPLEHRTLTIGRELETATSCWTTGRSRGSMRVSSGASDHYEIEDLGSKNGTHLNGRDVLAPQPLHDGDEIQIALRYKLAFVDAGATAPLSFEAPRPSAACGSMRQATRCTSTASCWSRRSLPSNTGCWKSCMAASGRGRPR